MWSVHSPYGLRSTQLLTIKMRVTLPNGRKTALLLDHGATCQEVSTIHTLITWTGWSTSYNCSILQSVLSKSCIFQYTALTSVLTEPQLLVQASAKYSDAFTTGNTKPKHGSIQHVRLSLGYAHLPLLYFPVEAFLVLYIFLQAHYALGMVSIWYQ